MSPWRFSWWEEKNPFKLNRCCTKQPWIQPCAFVTKKTKTLCHIYYNLYFGYERYLWIGNMRTGDWWLVTVAGHLSKINKSRQIKLDIELRSSLFFVNFNWYITIEIHTQKKCVRFVEMAFYRWWFWTQAMVLCSMARTLKHNFKLVKVSTQTFGTFLFSFDVQQFTPL